MRCLMKQKGDDQHICLCDALFVDGCEGIERTVSICKQLSSTKNTQTKKKNWKNDGDRENATHQKMGFIPKVFRSGRTSAETFELIVSGAIFARRFFILQFSLSVTRYVPRWFHILRQWESSGGRQRKWSGTTVYQNIRIKSPSPLASYSSVYPLTEHAFSARPITFTQTTVDTGYRMMRSKAKTTAKVFSLCTQVFHSKLFAASLICAEAPHKWIKSWE